MVDYEVYQTFVVLLCMLGFSFIAVLILCVKFYLSCKKFNRLERAFRTLIAWQAVPAIGVKKADRILQILDGIDNDTH